MAENTKIEWCDHTFNPWEGCQKVGPGCDNCYAEARNARFAGGQTINWGPGAPRRRTSGSNWRLPLKWNQQAKAAGIRYRVFCASLADVFDNEVDPAWRAELFALIAATPHLDWLLLTKRIGNVAKMIEAPGMQKCGLPPNVWLGATIVNQPEADRDITKLLALPARVRFLSMEPLLGPVDLRRWLDRCDHGSRPGPGGAGGVMCAECEGRGHGCHRLHWIIVGGESGPGARPMHPDWARSLRDQCQAAGVPFLFKQWGEFSPTERTMTEVSRSDKKLACVAYSDSELLPTAVLDRVGKKAAGRLLDGAEHNGFPDSVEARNA